MSTLPRHDPEPRVVRYHMKNRHHLALTVKRTPTKLHLVVADDQILYRVVPVTEERYMQDLYLGERVYPVRRAVLQLLKRYRRMGGHKAARNVLRALKGTRS